MVVLLCGEVFSVCVYILLERKEKGVGKALIRAQCRNQVDVAVMFQGSARLAFDALCFTGPNRTMKHLKHVVRATMATM